jgi:gliding motility-associated protein GldM
VIVNESLHKTTENFGLKNEKVYADFNAAKDKDPKKVAPYLDRAQKAKVMAKELVEVIEKLKKELIIKVDKKDPAAADTIIEKLKWIDSKDNYDIPSNIMIGSDAANPKDGEFTARDLKNRLGKTREEFIKLFEGTNANTGKPLFLPTVKKEMDLKLASLKCEDGVENGEKESWELINFEHVPLVAVITILSKIQADVRNAESDVVSELYKAVKGQDVTFDKLTAKVIAPSSYILAGDEYKADVLLVAYNSTSNPKIFTGQIDTTIKDEFKNKLKGEGTELKDISAGAGHYVVPTSAEGLQTWGGVIEVESPEGKKYYPFSGEYTVAKPAVAISPTKMNVFYIGVDNPVEISAAGVAPENLAPSMSGGSLSGSKGKYTVRVTAGTECSISVSAKSTTGGPNRPQGPPQKFRIKPIPNPVATVGGVKEGVIRKNLLIASGAVIPKMENFDFDLKPVIVSFDVSTVVAGDIKTIPTNGGNFSASQLSLLQGTKGNGRVYIENIKVRMPDGSVRAIGSVNLKVQL